MNVGIKISSIEKPEYYVDLIVNYRWWYPGKDSWKVESKSIILPKSSGEWAHVFTYGPDGSSLSLYGGDIPDYDPKKEMVIDIYFSLNRMPNWPPSDMQSSDEGPASSNYFNTSMADELRWKVRWIN